MKLKKDPEDPKLLLAPDPRPDQRRQRRCSSRTRTAKYADAPKRVAELPAGRAKPGPIPESDRRTDAGAAHCGPDAAPPRREPRPASTKRDATSKAAAEAQQIVAEQRPTLNSLSTLAFYTLLHRRLRSRRQSARKEAEAARQHQIRTRSRSKNSSTNIEENAANTSQTKKARGKSRKSGRRQSPESLENPLEPSAAPAASANSERRMPGSDGPCWARTYDLEIKSLLLYQLS